MFNRDWMVDADIDGSKTDTFGPRSGLVPWVGVTVGVGVAVGVGVGVEPPTGTRLNACAAVPLQVYCCSWVLSAVPAAGTSRHLPLLRLTKWYAPLASWTGCHCWLLPPP